MEVFKISITNLTSNQSDSGGAVSFFLPGGREVPPGDYSVLIGLKDSGDLFFVKKDQGGKGLRWGERAMWLDRRRT